MTMVRGSVAKTAVATVIVAADGSGDYTDIQTAIDSLPSGGGVVYVREGTYSISTSITFGKSNVSIIGAGKSTEISAASDWPSSTSMVMTESYSAILLENIYFNGNSRGTLTGVFIDSGTNITIRNCWFEDCDNVAIKALKATVSDNFIIITDNFIWSGASSGIAIMKSKLCIISNNHIYLNGARGIDIFTDSEDVLVTGNIVVDNGGVGVNIDDSDLNHISGNIISNNTGDNVRIRAGSGETSNNNIVVGNSINNGSAYGVNINDSRCTDNFIHGNMIIGNSSGVTSDSGTTTTISDNK